MEYYYTPPSCVLGHTLRIEGDEYTHIVRVMRRGAGDTVRVVDGVGNAYDATIDKIEKHVLFGVVTAQHVRLHEPSFRATLAVGLLKNPARFDMLIEKATELGVSAFVPLQTARTVARQPKADRWQSIALAAMKQAGRCVLPAVHPVSTLDTAITNAAPGTHLILLHETVDHPLLSDLGPWGPAPVLIMIGPEGGFSEEEVQRAAGAGCVTAGLGDRRLRTETAAMAAAALIFR
jgi:16S rRNA (uracil1498-N3)-methyltransferase